MNSIALGRTDQDIARLGSFSAASQNLLPGELEDANRKGSGLRLASDITGALGSVLNFGGAQGFNPFAPTGTSIVPDIFRPNVPVPAAKPPIPSSFALR